MWFPLLGLFTGLLLGTIFTFAVPVIYAKYLSIAVLAALDSLLGAWHALLEHKFDSPILISGFFTNILLAAGLAYLGDLLGIDLYLAAVVAFGLRIFSNIGFIRRQIIFRLRQKKQTKASKKGESLSKNPEDASVIQDNIHFAVNNIAVEDIAKSKQNSQDIPTNNQDD